MSRREKEILQMDVDLTDGEKLSMSRQCLADMVRIGELEDTLASFKAQKSGEIKGLQEHFNLTSNKVLRGKEFRAVPCRIVYDFERKIKFWLREDTHEIVKDDIISESELQEELDLHTKEDILWHEDLSTFGCPDHETILKAWERLFPDQTPDQLIGFCAAALATDSELSMPNGAVVGQDSGGWYILKPSPAAIAEEMKPGVGEISVQPVVLDKTPEPKENKASIKQITPIPFMKK